MANHFKLGLVGHPVAHSLSPSLHNCLLELAGLAGSYQLFDISSDMLKSQFDELKDGGVSGLNVTIPHKTAIIDLLDQVESDAKLLGAVNTVSFDSETGLSRGNNTDVFGFSCALESLSLKNGRCALIYGYGGSARAVALGLSRAGYEKIYVFGRSLDKALEFVQLIGKALKAVTDDIEIALFEGAFEEIELLVNCAPIGLNNVELPNQFFDLLSRLNKEVRVIDLVYSRSSRAKTEVVSAASDLGLKAQDGKLMLIGQATASFELWTGVKILPDQLIEAFASQNSDS